MPDGDNLPTQCINDIDVFAFDVSDNHGMDTKCLTSQDHPPNKRGFPQAIQAQDHGRWGGDQSFLKPTNRVGAHCAGPIRRPSKWYTNRWRGPTRNKRIQAAHLDARAAIVVNAGKRRDAATARAVEICDRDAHIDHTFCHEGTTPRGRASANAESCAP